MDDILRVEVQSLNGSTLVTVIGEVDACSMLALKAPLDELSLERRIFVDMSRVRFMDSSGLQVILTQRMRMIEHGGSIYICRPSSAVARLVKVAGLDRVLYPPDEVVLPASYVEAG